MDTFEEIVILDTALTKTLTGQRATPTLFILTFDVNSWYYFCDVASYFKGKHSKPIFLLISVPNQQPD